MRTIPKNKKALQTNVLLYFDGESENDYFKSLKQKRYGKILVKIEPRLPKRQGYKKIIEEVDSVFRDKSIPAPTCAFIVLDMDTIHNQDKLQDYLEKKENLLRKRGRNRVFFIESRPCFELWFLLHWKFADRLYTSCDSLVNDLQAFLPGYSKKKKYRKNLYDLTKDKIDAAINNAKAIMNRERVADEHFSYTSVHDIIEKIDKL